MTQDQHPLPAADDSGSGPVQEGTNAAHASGDNGERGAAPDTQTEAFSPTAPDQAVAGDDYADAAYAVGEDDGDREQDAEEDADGQRHDYVRFRTPIFAVVATLLSLALLALLAGNIYQFLHNRDQQVIATVNGAKITQADFIKDDANSQTTLDDLIGNQLVLQEAKRQKVSIPTSQINDQVAAIKKSVGTEQDYQTALKNNNLTESELRDRIRLNLLEQQLGAKGVSVSDAEAQTYYNQNKAQFGTQTFDQAKDSIKTQLLQQKQSTAVQAWIAGLRKNAKVNIHLPS